MSNVPRLLLLVLLFGGVAAAVGIGLTILVNWFFRGEVGISGDEVARLVVLGFVFGCMPLGLVWARWRKEKR